MCAHFLQNGKKEHFSNKKDNLNTVKSSKILYMNKNEPKILNGPIMNLNIKYRNIAQPCEADRNELKVVKKKI